MPPENAMSSTEPADNDLSAINAKLEGHLAPGADKAPTPKTSEPTPKDELDTSHIEAKLAGHLAPGSAFGLQTEPTGNKNDINSFAASIQHKNADQLDKYDAERMSYFSPQDWYDLKKVRPDIAIPIDKQREIFDAKRAGKIEDKGPGFLEKLGAGAKSLAKGVIDVMGDVNPDIYAPELSKGAPSSGEKLRAMGSPILKSGEAADYLGAHIANGTFDLWGLNDWLGEKSGLQTPDDTFKKVAARDAIDTARAADERTHQSIYSRMAEYPIAKSAVKAGLTLLGADKDIPPEKLDEHAQKIVDKFAESQNYPVNQDIEGVSSFLTPGGLGMEEFAVANAAASAFGKALKIPSMLRTAEQQQALYNQNLVKQVDKASKVGTFTKVMGKTADTLEDLSAKLEDLKKEHPYAAGALATLPGIVVGSQVDPEHPITGAVLGGLGEAGALKAIGKVSGAAPRVLADLGQARAITAGGGKLFETAGKLPDAGEVTQKIFGGYKGRMLDKLSDIALSYGRGGVDMMLLGGALGAIKGEDWEDTKDAMGQGLAYGLFHQTVGKMMGQDPVAIQRDQRRKDVEFVKQLQQMDPQTQDAMLHLQDFNTYVGTLQSQLAKAQTHYSNAVANGDEEGAKQSGNLVKNLTSQLNRAATADFNTRQAYSRSMGDLVTDALRATNGVFREGQKNVGLSILNTDQITQKLLQSNPGMTPEAARNIATSGHFFSGVGNGRGIELGGNIPEALRAQGEGRVFDPLKSTVVMNSDILKKGMADKSITPADAFRHEFGHALWSIPEFQDLMRANGVEEGLFDTVYKDLNGNEQPVNKGQFSNKKLVERYWDHYVKDVIPRPGETQKQAEERFAAEQGMWDNTHQRWDEDKIANYMKDEIRADVYGKGLGSTGLDSLDSVSQHVLDWARLKVQNKRVRQAVEGIFGHGGADPYNSIPSPATGVDDISPQLWSAYRNAFREFKDMNGNVSQSIDAGRIMPVISPLKMAGSASLRAKYGRDSGLFKTEFKANVYDKEGNLVGTTTLPTQNAYEGFWGNENGNLVQRSGYGSIPAEAAGLQVPEGGSLRISREIVMKPDGETPEMLSRKEIKQLVKTRAQTIRDALDGAYKGEPNGFRPVSEDGLTYRGNFTPEQIAALRSLPESIVPAKIKDTILRFNDLLTKGLGHRMLIDYAARVDDKGRAVSFSPKIYDLVPIGMHFSKDGNFLITTVSVSRLLDKLNLWADRLPGRLAPWGGDKEAFFREFSTKYLPNHLEKWQNPDAPDKPPAARPGETDLDPDPKVALEKKQIFNDFLNLTSNEFRDRNPDRTIVPRRKGDPRGKDPNRTIMSVRADSVADLLESSAHPLPINYELQKLNFLPSKDGEQPAIKPQEQAELERQIKLSEDRIEQLRASGQNQDAREEQNDLQALRVQLANMQRPAEPAPQAIQKGLGAATEQTTFNFLPAGKSKAPSQEELDKMKAGLPSHMIEMENRNGGKKLWLFTPEGSDPIGEAYVFQNPNNPKELNVINTEVDSDFRKQGYGQALYRAIAKYAQSVGATDLVATTVSDKALRTRESLFATEPMQTEEGRTAKSEIPSDVSYLPAKKLDEAHAKAIESGDTEEAQRLVDEAAKKAGFPSVYPLYRGFTRKPDPEQLRTRHGRATLSFTDVPEIANLYAHDRDMWDISRHPSSSVKKFYLDTKNPYDMRSFGTTATLGDIIEDSTRYNFYLDSQDTLGKTDFGIDKLHDLLMDLHRLKQKTAFNSNIDVAGPLGTLDDFKEVAEKLDRLRNSKRAKQDEEWLPEEILYGILPNVELDTYALADSPSFIENLKSLGYDGLIHKDTVEAGKSYFPKASVAGRPIEEVKGIDTEDDYSHDTYRPFEQNQIKLADPATYDDEGKLIPLSQRFNPESNDIRYLPAKKGPKPQVGYDDTYLKKAMADGKDGMVKLTRPFRADEALPLLSQVPPITEQVQKDSFTYDRPAEVELYQHEGQPVTFKWDPVMLEKPVYKDIAVEHAGKPVQFAMADKQTATGGDSGGVMHAFLKMLREVVIKDPTTGEDLIGVWANNEWKPAKNMKDKVRMFGANNLLTYLMGPDAHGSNTRSVRRISNEIDNAPLSPKEKDTFLIIANKGVKTVRAAEQNKTIKDAQEYIAELKEKLKAKPTPEEAQRIKNDIKLSEKSIADAEAKLQNFQITPEEEEFAAIVRNFKSSFTRYKNGKGSLKVFQNREQEFNDFLKSDTFKKLQKTVKGKHMIKLDDTFKGRKAAVESLMGLTIKDFNIDHILPETADFRNGRIHHIVGSVELSKNPKLGAVYLGDDPEQAKFMTPEEAAAAKIFKASNKHVIHEAYSWLMLGPKNGNHFLNTNPKTGEEYFPDFRKKYAATKEDPEKRDKILNATEANLINTMRDQKAFPLVLGGDKKDTKRK
jgi:predicted GNAT family acetyltransferase